MVDIKLIPEKRISKDYFINWLYSFNVTLANFEGDVKDANIFRKAGSRNITMGCLNNNVKYACRIAL